MRAPWAVPDETWLRVEPLIRAAERGRPGRRRVRVDDRAALTGILFVLSTGVSWAHLPRELGCGSGMTCWRRLREWNERGVWEELRRVLAVELSGASRIDWSRARIEVRPPAARRRARLPG